MNIPLDNLYHWIRGFAQHPVMLYVFRPHGSKDIFDLTTLENYDQKGASSMTPMVICHDQEPLDFANCDFDYDLDKLVKLIQHRNIGIDPKLINGIIEEYVFQYSTPGLLSDFHPTWLNALECNEWTILLHSEVNSHDVVQFAAVGFYPVYYWSHAVISRDWYRFAPHDTRLKNRHAEKTFLIYCRDWTPNREYRLKFLDLVVRQNLTTDCVISTQHINNQGVHLKDYQVENPHYAFDAGAILNAVPDNTASSSSSAYYDVNDITSTRVSVVLETVVDDEKIHLTEKILRPIACAHPFILAAGPGSLEYLRSYGFKTFSDFWDESYDQEPDVILKLEKIILVMKQIQHLTDDDWQQIQSIADYNQQHFFSEEFINQVTTELTTNFNKAVDFCIENCGKNYWNWRKIVRRNGLVKKFSTYLKSPWARRTIKEIRQHRLRRSHNGSGPVVGQ